MKEREISLVDIIFEILLKWRMIIVFMVIGGLLLGGYSYLQSARTIENTKVLSDAEALIGLENKLTVEQKACVKAALGYANYDKYYNESLLMQIDGNNTPTTELIFKIIAPDEKTENALVRVYEQLFDTGVSSWLVQEGMDTAEAAKTNELIITENEALVTVNEYFVTENQVLITENVDTNYSAQAHTKKNDAFCIKVVHVDEDRCKELAKLTVEYVFAQKKNLEKLYGTHEVALVSETYATVVNEDLLSSQRAVVMNVYNSITYVDKLKSAFSSEQKQYYDLLKNGVNTDDIEKGTVGPTAVAVTHSPVLSTTYVILGMFLLAFLYVFYVFAAYILNNKLCVNDSLTDLFGIVQFGVVPKKEKRKKIFGFIDKGILALRNRNKRTFTREEAEEIVAVATKIAVKKSEGKEVCLVGCDVKKQTNDTCKNIKFILEKEDIKVKILDNVLYNAEEMEKLENVSCAVLVEKVGFTMYDEVQKELELLERYNINVLGGILAE